MGDKLEWRITCNTGIETIEAESMRVYGDNSLTLWNGEEMVAAFSSANWMSCISKVTRASLRKTA